MAEITLSDYTGYLVREIVKARQMVDDYSRGVALEYSKDAVMKHFPAPRFKLPKVELNIPVLVERASYSLTVRFGMKHDAFAELVQTRTDAFVRHVRSTGVARPGSVRRPVTRRTRSRARAAELADTILEFHRQLEKNPDPENTESIVSSMWGRITSLALVENQLLDVYRRANPRNELVTKTANELRDLVVASTVVDRTRIDSLLVNPETAAVKNGSSESSVFTIKVELLEEGVHIRSVDDERTGGTKPVVEFE